MGPKIDFDEINKIIKLLEDKNLAEFELEVEGFKIKIARKRPGRLPRRPRRRPPPRAPAAAAGESPPSRSAATSCRPAKGRSTYVTSPMVGTFYRAPAPNSPPFVEVGRAGQEEADALHRRGHEAHERDRVRRRRRRQGDLRRERQARRIRPEALRHRPAGVRRHVLEDPHRQPRRDRPPDHPGGQGARASRPWPSTPRATGPRSTPCSPTRNTASARPGPRTAT